LGTQGAQARLVAAAFGTPKLIQVLIDPEMPIELIL
jgi:hypothetical protein